jgi:hypothetical protein
MTTRTLALAIVRRYPAAWRERYEAEVRGLIDDASIHFRDLGELLRGLLTERARELLTSAENPGRTATILSLISPVAGGAFILLAWLSGYAVKSVAGSWSDMTEYVAMFVMFGLMVATFATWLRGWKRRNRAPWAAVPLSVPPGFVLVLLPMLFAQVAILAAFASDEPTYRPLIPIWVNRTLAFLLWANITGNLMSSLFPGRELLQAFARVSFAEGQLRSNQTWVQGCHDMMSKGVPSPLNDALTQVGKWTVERDSARARLKELGYEARFRGRIGQAGDQGITA